MNWKLKLEALTQKFKVPGKIAFILLGLASIVWFLVRVVPKPQRATYPCVRATAPWASAFVIYILGITASAFSFKRFGKHLKASQYKMAALFVAAGITVVFFTIPLTQTDSTAASLNFGAFAPNSPIGVAKGIMPGRVVWVHNPDATDKNCSNTSGDYWFDNTNQNVVDDMLGNAIRGIAGQGDLKLAWDTIFKYFNETHGRGIKGYTKGEKIYIKINVTNSCCASWSNKTKKTNNFDQMDSTPELCLSILRQLVNIVGVEESDIYLGDPFRKFHDLYWDLCAPEFPDVNYMDGNGDNGRIQTTPTAQSILKFSNGESARIPQEYVNSAYFINMPCLKSHDVGGITIAAKNHQGSIIEEGDAPNGQSAMFMHPYLPKNNPGHGKYRHLVDYMGYEHLGGKTLLIIVDGIWGGRNWDGIVEKWDMAPFNNDYPSSLFVSMDPVAIESVCYDFLLEEYKNKEEDIQFPYIDGADDYILQAADPANWPADIEYDPEGDGTVLTSLGTHEHWNNAVDKKYSRNLGTGNGIELYTEKLSSIKHSGVSTRLRIYPQPANGFIAVEIENNQDEIETVQLFDPSGRLVSAFTGKILQHQKLQIDNVLPGAYIISIKTTKGTSYSKPLLVN